VLPDDAPVQVEELSGGVSSSVLRAETGQFCVVIKQALPKLRVRDDWTSGVERALIEARAAEVLAQLLPPGAVLAPLHTDDERYLFVMGCAPPGAETWKTRLMRGEADPATAARVGELLGLLHGRSSGDAALAREFDDRQYFLTLRVDPYLHTTAERRPELAAAIGRQAEAMLARRECLVHGDYSPKNLLVDPAEPGTVILLDHEVTHYGDPAFDLAFCLTHLHLKACRFPERAEAYLALARTLWDAYLAAAKPPAPAARERNAVGLLGCIIAARVDGKSPVEYLETEELRGRVRDLARAILLGELATLDAAARATRAVLG
jgi:aminoglycoside phosphotransferase (APT) family kinase protein